jgi:acetate---CoA ligase (ADP-forming)
MRNHAPDLRPLIAPRSIAIVGASAQPTSIGGRPLANLRRFGFTGEIHLVSRSQEEIDGIRCVKTVRELPRDIDVALFVIPQHAVETTLEDCIERGVRAVILFSAGFAETGEEGAKLQARISARAREAGLLLSGPNGLGLVNHKRATPLTFGWIERAPSQDRPGVAIISQSGAAGMAMTYAAQSRGIPLAYMISSGNEAALTMSDYLRHALEDPEVAVAALFAEQIRDPQSFLQLCDRAAELRKPLLLLKLGRSERAKAAAQSHTGALVGDYGRIAATLQSRGVILVDTMDELLDAAGMLARYPVPDASGIAVMSDSGALVSVALDSAEPLGIDFPSPAPQTHARLREELPEFVQVGNPVDMTTQGMNDPGLFARVAQTLAGDAAFGSLALFAMPGAEEHAVARAHSLMPILKSLRKPVAYAVLGGDAGIAATKVLQENGISTFRTPDAALRALSHVMRYAAWLREHAGTPQSKAADRSTPASRLPAGVLTEHQAKQLLAEAGLPVPASRLVTDVAGLRAAAAELGFPLALKLQSAQVMHKTEAGGVALHINGTDELVGAYERMLARIRSERPQAVIDGVLVERMAERGVEIAVGVKSDAEWGPTLMVALGGIWIEVLKDTALVPAPAQAAAVRQALQRLRAWPLLQGVRGSPPADVDALVALVVRIGEFAAQHPELAEMDLNPVLVHPAGRGVTVVDASAVVDHA